MEKGKPLGEKEERLPRWSVVIPSYNEGKRIRAYLQEITAYFYARGESVEIIVVDDGSQDATRTVVEDLRQACSTLRLIRLASNHGKGYAVRTGMMSAIGELCLFADADGATPIKEIEKLEARIIAGADIAIGSRALWSPTIILKAKLYRKALSRIFSLAVRCLGVKSIVDTQCGFKLFRARVAKELFSVLQIDGYGFDVELLFVAQQYGYYIAQVAVNWTDQAGSKVRVPRDGLRMLKEVWTIRKNYLCGLYPRPGGTTRHLPSTVEARPVAGNGKWQYAGLRKSRHRERPGQDPGCASPPTL